jgi:CBS domain-containing protein
MPRSQPVASVMTTDVLTFSPDDTVEAAMTSMVERGIDGAPVVDEDGKVVGMLTTGDLIVQESQVHVPTVISLFGAYLELPSAHRKFDQDLRKALGGRVAEVMHDEPHTVTADDTLETAATVMHDHDVSRLPVVRDGRLVGIIARNDILRAIITDRS